MRPFFHLKLISVLSLLFAVIVGLVLLGPSILVTHAVGISLKVSPKSEAISASSTSSCGAWNIIPSPNPGQGNNALYGVAAISTRSVWAVGTSQNNGVGTPQTLIEHWDGTSWSVASSPNPGTSNNILYAATRVPATSQVWAVWVYNNNGLNLTLIEHWDGTSWSVVSSPNPGSQFNVLYGVTAISANNAWAVGNYTSTSNGPNLTLIEHWNGTSWQVVSSPNPGSQYNYLNGAIAVSGSNAWVVGTYQSSNSSSNLQTLTERWNGKKWSVVLSPSPGSWNNSFSSVARVPGTNQLWAVGITSNSDYQNNLTLIEHWDGTSWSVVSSPTVGTSYSYLEEIARVPGTSHVWAVGFYNTNSGTQTLIEFYC